MRKKMQNRTNIKQQLVLDQLRANGGNVELSCKIANSSRAQFYVWLEKYPHFRKEVIKVYTNIYSFAKCRIYLKALKHDVKALEILKSQAENKLKKL